MRFTLTPIYWLVLLVCISSCKKTPPEEHGSPPDAEWRTVSPHEVNLSGIRLYSTVGEINKLLPSLNCRNQADNIDVCNWKPTQAEQESTYLGISQVKFTFFRDTLHTIRVYYTQILDVEFTNFEKAVRAKYGYASGGKSVDTTGYEWRYDSLLITFTPNRKQHWTGTMFTYSPVLEFQERFLYQHWLDEVGQQKPKALY